MATIAQIRADLVGSSAVFRSEMIAGARQANQSLVQIRGDVRQTADSILMLNRAAAGFVGFEAVKTGVKDLLDAQRAAQQIHYTLTSATGSEASAQQAYKQVEEEADRLGLSLQSSALGFAQMSAAAGANGIAMKDQLALFDGLARSSTVLHLSAETNGRAINALSQIFSKGKIQAEELRQQLGEAIPGVVPRFQQAVMEMTKGTDLAGKSFDQLLQSGDLTVQRFLPALIQALQETGRGAEQAATGLNAEMNRLSTAWFKLKSDLSGGLFNDAATASVRLMAENLEHLADVAGVTGGIVVSRLAGIGLGKVYDAGAGAVAAKRQAREAAEAASALAKANVEAAAAEVKSTQAAVDGVATVRRQTFEHRRAAEAIHAKALAENEAAQVTLAHQQNAATLSANIRAQREAMASAVIAQNNLARAQRQYDVAVASGNTLKTQQIALEARLIEAKAASAAATEAQIAAERQLAATSTGGLLARGAKSLGGFALRLVGGSWGAAVAAIGSVGYAIYDLNKASEKWRQETQEQVKSLQDLREQVQAAAAGYGQLHSAMGLAQTLDVYRQSSDELQKKRAELDDLQSKADALREAMSQRGGGGPLAGLHLEQLNDRIKELQDQLPATTREVDVLGTKLAGSMAPAVDAVKGAIDRLRNGGGLRDVLAGWSADVDAGIKAVGQADADIESGLSAIASAGASYAKKVAIDGKTASQVLQYNLDQVVKNIKAKHLVAAEEAKAIAAAQKEAAPHIQEAANYDAAEAAKKAARQAVTAADQQRQAYENLTNSQNGQLASLQQQLDGVKKVSTAQQDLNEMLAGGDAAFRKLSATQQTDAIARQRHIVSLTDQAEALKQATKDAQAYAVVQDNLARIAQQAARGHQDALAGIGQGSKTTADQQELAALQRQYEDLMASAGRSLRGGHISQDEYDKEIDEYKAALDHMLRDTQDFYDQRDVMQADWKNGAVKAMEDWRDAAANNADLAASVITNAATNMTNAFVEFAATGKLSFKDFADSLIRDLARIAYQKAIAGIFDYALGAYMGYDASGGAGTSTYNSMGGVTHVDFGGGRAGGGSTVGGTLYEVAEGGRPELYQSGGRTYLLSGEDGHVAPARSGSATGGGMSVAAGDVEVQINITNNGQAVQAQQTGQRMDGKKLMIDLVLQAVQSDIAKGGGTAQVMQQRFGLSRRGVPMGG